MSPMTYKDYAARIEYSDEDGCLACNGMIRMRLL